MTPEQFTYWLQGFAEMNYGKPPSRQQWKMIKDHLALCFNKVTPPYMQWQPTSPPTKICDHGESGGRIGVYVPSKPKGGGGAC